MTTDADRWQALCRMLDNGVAHALTLNMNDMFAYSCAEVEEAELSHELTEVVDAYLHEGWKGPVRWAAKKRRQSPLPEIAAALEQP